MLFSSLPALSHRNPWLVMPVLVLLAYGAYLAVQWPLAGNHLFGYISFNAKHVHVADAVIPQKFVSEKFGYDGQFYYRFALDPFSNEEQVQGLSIDHPQYRQQRILLPALTWVFARGDPELTAKVMLAINLLAVAALTLAGGALLKFHGLSPWQALLLAFYPGFAISIERFLSEPLSCLLLFLSLLCLAHKRVAWGGVILASAVLARETAIVAALALAGVWLLQSVLRSNADRWKAPGPAYWMPPVITYVFWQLWLLDNWSKAAVSTVSGLLDWPLAGIVISVRQLITDLNPVNTFYLCLLLATFTWITMAAVRFPRASGPYRWMWLAYLALATLLGPPIWNNSPSFVRTLTELNLLALMVYLLTVRTPHRWVLAAWLGCWLLTAGGEGYRLHLISQSKVASVSGLIEPQKKAGMNLPEFDA